MAFAGERGGQDSHMAFLQACSLYGNLCGGSSVQVSDRSQLGFLGYNNYCDNTVLEEGEGSDNSSGSTKNASLLSYLPSLLDPAATNANCTGFVFGTANSPPEDAQSVINFRTSYDNLECHEESLLSFEQGELVVSGNSNRMVDHEDDYSIWVDDVDHNTQWNQPTYLKVTNETRLSEDLNCFETASSYDLMSSDNQHREQPFGWLFPAPVATTGSIQESCSEPDEACLLKRPYTGGEMQAAAKKQCFDSHLKPKFKSSASKDPQSIAAKNRRERISERLKILQDLVPNGAKVDLVTMLEKAISYVKFLQLQVKVLAADEFWPEQGGKAPEVGQVKEAIDAILSSHKDQKSSSK